MYYHRTYETVVDTQHNQSGGHGRARSGSVGIMDAQGNRTQRHHYHAQRGSTTLVREMPDAGPHTQFQLNSSHTTYSYRPMLIPGAVTDGPEMGTKRRH